MKYLLENALFIIILIPMISAFIGFYLGIKSEDARNKFNTITTIAVFALICYLYPFIKSDTLYFHFPGIMGTGLYLKLDMLRYVLIFLTAFLWILSQVFSTSYLLKYKHRNRYYMFFILTLANTLGVFMSEHILNMFTFFELMTITSYFLVIHDEDEYTHKAGNIYIAMSIAGGLIQLMGIFLLYNYTSTLLITQMPAEIELLGNIRYLIAILIIIGFGVKACMFPLHIWLPKVYPPTPSPATALFSGVLTKTGIFGILITLELMNFDIALSLFILIVGLVNMFLGGLLAIHHRNIKKIFAYSSMSQIGYILLGIGLIGLLKDYAHEIYFASVFHMINHAVTKVLLFFGCGIIFMTIQKMSLNEIKGFGRNKPLLKIIFTAGFLGTIGLPGFNGFASKTMLHHAVYELSHLYNKYLAGFVEVIFLLSSAFTVAYLIKIFIFLFVKENKLDSDDDYQTTITKLVIYPMVILSGLILIIGIRPDMILKAIGYAEIQHLHLYTLENIFSSFVVLAMGVIIYIFYIHKRLIVYENGDTYILNPTYEWFDLEKDLFGPILKVLFNYITLVLDILDTLLVSIVTKISSFIKYVFSIEFYKDVSYYNRLASIFFSLKYKNKKKADSTSISNLVEKVHIEINQHSDILQNNRVKTSLIENIDDLGYKLSSITYSIISFALILAILLVIMVVV